MKTMTFGAAGAVAALLVAGALPAWGQAQRGEPRANISLPSPGFTFYNRPGATIAEHDAELRECAAIMGDLPRIETYQQGLIAESMEAAANLARGQAAVENCMVVRGWRVVELPRNIGQRLERMPRDQLSAQLATVVGVEQPVGEIVRVFANEAARASTISDTIPNTPQLVLSLQSVDISDVVRSEPAGAVVFRGAILSQPLDEAGIAALQEGDTIAVLHVTGSGATNGHRFNFARFTGPDDDSAPADGTGGDVFMAEVPRTLFGSSPRDRREAVLVFRIRPGRWTIAGKGNGLSFCLGAPTTEVRQGDVVYFGTYAFAARTIGPHMDEMTEARETLAANPAFASRLRPAEWVNGTTFHCGSTANYALEAVGAPFEPGYVGGTSPRP